MDTSKQEVQRPTEKIKIQKRKKQFLFMLIVQIEDRFYFKSGKKRTMPASGEPTPAYIVLPSGDTAMR